MDELLNTHLPFQRDLIKTCKAIENSEKLVRWLNAKSFPTALVTSSSSKSVEYKISFHPWIDLIPLKILGDDPLIKHGKPSPDPFLLASKLLGVEPEYCWAIEDSESGIKSALAAKCKVWAFKQRAKSEVIDMRKNPIYINNISIFLDELRLVSKN